MSRELGDTRHMLNQVLEQRDRLFPKREPQNTAAMREAATAYANALRGTREPNWKPDMTLVEPVKDISESAVFICGHIKSGTTLLWNLLDSHPELIVMPGDSGMIRLIDSPTLIYEKISLQDNTPYTWRLKGWDTYWVNHFINAMGQKPFWIMGGNDEPYLDFVLYLGYWLERLPPSDRSPFLAVVWAFYCANPKRAANPKIWVEKDAGNEHRVDRILNLFPSARFIHIVRDPRPHIATLKRFTKIRERNWSVDNFAYSVRRSIETGLSNQERLGKERYHLLHYEDLVTNPEAEMKKVALFLGIAMDDILLRPTINGLPTKSNSMYKDRQVHGKILANLSDGWKSELESLEQENILAILYPAAKRLGYEWNVGAVHYYQVRFRHLVSRILGRMRRQLCAMSTDNR